MSTSRSDIENLRFLSRSRIEPDERRDIDEEKGIYDLLNL